MNDENVLLLLWCHLPLGGRRRTRMALGGTCLPSSGFCRKAGTDVLALPGPVIEGQVHRVLLFSTEKGEEKNAVFDKKTVEFGQTQNEVGGPSL